MPVGLPIHNGRKQQKNSCEKYCRTWYDIDIEIEINLHGTAHGKGKNTQVIALLFAGNHLLFQILTLSFKGVRIINLDGGRSIEGPWARTSVFNNSLSMKTHENQPATGKTHFPGVGGGVFYVQGTQVSIWASRSSCALGTTGGGPLQTFPWWLALESLQTFGAVFYHKRCMRSFKAGRWILHDIQNFEKKTPDLVWLHL